MKEMKKVKRKEKPKHGFLFSIIPSELGGNYFIRGILGSMKYIVSYQDGSPVTGSLSLMKSIHNYVQKFGPMNTLKISLDPTQKLADNLLCPLN